jgi:hypothetical protein
MAVVRSVWKRLGAAPRNVKCALFSVSCCKKPKIKNRPPARSIDLFVFADFAQGVSLAALSGVFVKLHGRVSKLVSQDNYILTGEYHESGAAAEGAV